VPLLRGTSGADLNIEERPGGVRGTESNTWKKADIKSFCTVRTRLGLHGKRGKRIGRPECDLFLEFRVISSGLRRVGQIGILLEGLSSTLEKVRVAVF
jgi:hypothetical protein